MEDETSDSMADSRDIDDLVEQGQELISLSGIHHGQILRAGVELGLFDFIDRAGAPASEIADELDLDPDHTYRLLRGLAAIGVLTE